MKFAEALATCAPPPESTETAVVGVGDFDVPATASIAYGAPTHRRAKMPRHGLPVTIGTVSRHFRIDPLLLDAIVARESGGRANAVSYKGAMGLMQVMPATARGLGVTDPARLLTDPGLNLVTGATYLKQLQGQFGNNVPAVLAAYNAGPGAVRRFRGIPRYAETQAYVRTIMGRYQAARRGVLR